MGSAFLIAVIAAAIAFLGWRGVRYEQRRMAAAFRRAQQKMARRDPGAAPPRAQAPLTLEKDPKTGVYRPKE